MSLKYMLNSCKFVKRSIFFELTYDKVTVVAGGNDCDDGVDVETVIEDMTDELIKQYFSLPACIITTRYIYL